MFSGPHYVNVWKCVSLLPYTRFSKMEQSVSHIQSPSQQISWSLKAQTPFYGQSKVWHAFKATLVRLQLHICTLLYKPPPPQTVLFMLRLSVLCCSQSAKYKLLQTIIAQLFSPRWSWMNNSRGTAATCQWEAVEINFQMLNSNVAGQLHHPHQSAEYSRL